MIPGIWTYGVLPGYDPLVKMTFGNPETGLLTDDGSKVEIKGDIKVVAKAVFDYALDWIKPLGDSPYRNSGISFSIFDFDFRNGLEVKARWNNNDEQMLALIQEVQLLVERYNKLKAFW